MIMFVDYFVPYKADRTALLNKGGFQRVLKYYYDTQLFNILKGKEEGQVYWKRGGFIRFYNDYKYNAWDMESNRRKYLTNWPSLRHPIRCYTSSTRSYAYKNNTKKYKGQKLINLRIK
jgi:acyl-CoA-binding protein